jgi:hypothetical protein
MLGGVAIRIPPSMPGALWAENAKSSTDLVLERKPPSSKRSS